MTNIYEHTKFIKVEKENDKKRNQYHYASLSSGPIDKHDEAYPNTLSIHSAPPTHPPHTHHHSLSFNLLLSSQNTIYLQSKNTHMISIRIPSWPILLLPIISFLILLPEFLDCRPNFGWGLDFFESEIRIILHACRLTQ